MAPEIWVNISSGNGLLPDGTKPFPEPTSTYNLPEQAGNFEEIGPGEQYFEKLLGFRGFTAWSARVKRSLYGCLWDLTRPREPYALAYDTSNDIQKSFSWCDPVEKNILNLIVSCSIFA